MPTVKLYRPFIILGLLSALAALYASLREYTTEVGGQEFFAVYAAVTMLSVCVIDLNIRLRQTNPHLMDVRKQWLKPLVALVVATGVITSIAVYALVMPFGARVVVPVISQAQWTRTQTDSVVQSTTGLTY